MSNPITKIQMTGFRGAVGELELEFNPEKDFVMLFGENGSGKSSILDAIDVVCSGTNGCLDGISVGQNPGRYLCSLGSQPNSLRVTVHSDGDNWTGTMSRNAISVAGPATKPKVKILRRNSILELVLAQPSDRYKALSQFLDISCIELSEGTLQQRLTDTDSAINVLIRDKDRMETQLDNLWKSEGCPGPGETSMAWAEGKVTTGIGGLNDRLTRLRTVTSAIVAAVAAKENFDARTAAHRKEMQQLDGIDQEIAAAPSVSSSIAVKLLESLEKAKVYVEAEATLDKCPTCLRPIGRDLLLTTINTEFKQLSSLKILSDRQQQIQERARIAASHLDEARTSLVQALKKVQEVTQAGDLPEVTGLNIAWPVWENAAEDINFLLGICDQFGSIMASLELQRDSAQRDVSLFNSIKERWRDIKDANDKMADLNRILTGMKRAFEIIHDKRVAFTQSILDSIRKEADSLFQSIHPGENIGLEQLKMDEERRGSVNQTGVFHKHTGILPQAVFSESHLDTLGFCVWLALAKRETPEETVLLIDDIFSSVDATHLGRVIDLFSAESPNFLQVILATHYRLWWDRCQNARGIQRIHLGRWCATNGIAARNMPRVLDELRVMIGEPVLDRQGVSSKAGILLESILDDLALLYECSLPHNIKNEHTLGALIDGCRRLFSRHNLTVQINANWNVVGQPENWQATAVRAAYDRVDSLRFIRNEVGCHFSTPGMEIPDREVRDFGTATIALVEALTCPNCGLLATKTETDGTHLRCSCAKKAVRMTPVTVP